MQRAGDIRDILPSWGGLTRVVLLVSAGLYVAQLLGESWLGLPVYSTLAWWPFGSGQFQIWQPLSSNLLNGPDPLGALLSWIALYYFLPPAEQALGRRGVARAAAFVLAVCIGSGLLLQLVGAVVGAGPAAGPGALLMALLVVFGLTRPNATILLFFVLPIRALWLAWGSGLLALLYFLATRSLGSAVWLAAWVAAWLWLRGVWTPLRRAWLRARYWWLHRRLRRLEVIEGGRGRTRDEGGGGPLFH